MKQRYQPVKLLFHIITNIIIFIRSINIVFVNANNYNFKRARGSVVVQELHYKPKGNGLETQ
jgi:hypothetical protein